MFGSNSTFPFGHDWKMAQSRENSREELAKDDGDGGHRQRGTKLENIGKSIWVAKKIANCQQIRTKTWKRFTPKKQVEEGESMEWEWKREYYVFSDEMINGKIRPLFLSPFFPYFLTAAKR
jgi:hypothetical protein